jgi:hypothetical protein
MTFRLPNDSQHIAIIGRNGTGKTLAALWHLSKRPFDKRPELIVDFKRDEHIAAIEKAVEIPVGDVPTDPGIYVVRPNVSDPSLLFQTLARAYQRENIGIWFDEGFILSQDSKVEGMFENILTQGRSKHIPLIVLVQRPVWVSRFVYSESSFFQLFHLQDKRDVITLHSVIPEAAFRRLPEFHSAYYDVGKNRLEYLAPVPREEEILATIDKRLTAMQKRDGPNML